MIFNIKKHNSNLYNTLLILSRNLFFYKKITNDTFETRRLFDVYAFFNYIKDF